MQRGWLLVGQHAGVRFYRAACNADAVTRYSEENSVRLSVRLSVRPSVCHTRDP